MDDKESILKKCLKLLKRRGDFEDKVKEFKEEYPESYIHGNFEERIKGKILAFWILSRRKDQNMLPMLIERRYEEIIIGKE